MNVRIEFDGGLDKFISGARGSTAKVNEMEDRIVRQAGMAGLENIASNVQSKSGRLAQSLEPGTAENIYIHYAGGGKGYVVYGSTCPYFVPVEKGYNQSNRVSKATGRKPSLWVPGAGSGGNFSYNPGSKTGMKLSGRFVPGQHMFEKSIPDTQEDFKEITKKEVGRLFKSLF